MHLYAAEFMYVTNATWWFWAKIDKAKQKILTFILYSCTFGNTWVQYNTCKCSPSKKNFLSLNINVRIKQCLYHVNLLKTINWLPWFEHKTAILFVFVFVCFFFFHRALRNVFCPLKSVKSAIKRSFKACFLKCTYNRIMSLH